MEVDLSGFWNPLWFCFVVFTAMCLFSWQRSGHVFGLDFDISGLLKALQVDTLVYERKHKYKFYHIEISFALCPCCPISFFLCLLRLRNRGSSEPSARENACTSSSVPKTPIGETPYITSLSISRAVVLKIILKEDRIPKFDSTTVRGM